MDCPIPLTTSASRRDRSGAEAVGDTERHRAEEDQRHDAVEKRRMEEAPGGGVAEESVRRHRPGQKKSR